MKLFTRMLPVLLAAVGLASGYAATRFLPSLNEDLPEVARAGTLPARPSARLARRVVLVVVDGLRADASRGLPFLDRLRRRGADLRAWAPFPTLSLPNYVTLLTGVEPRFSGVRTNDASFAVRLDSVPARARKAGLKVRYLSDGAPTLSTLFGLKPDRGSNPAGRNDLRAAIRRALVESDLLILVLMDVDRAGHRHGGASAAYRDAARRVDRRLEALLARLDLDRDAVVVTADHGHSDGGGHGGLGTAAQEVPLILSGAGVRPGSFAKAVRLEDVAPTLAALLGIPSPVQAWGSVITPALALEPARSAVLAAADSRRQERLAQHRGAIDKRARERHRTARKRDLPLAAIGLSALLGLMTLAWRRGWTTVGLRAVLGGLAFPVVFCGLLLLSGRGLSECGVPGDARSLWYELSGYGLGAMAAHLAARPLALRGLTPGVERLAHARGCALVGLVVAATAALAAWALAGETWALTLPEPCIMMLPATTYVASTLYALAALIALAIESARAR